MTFTAPSDPELMQIPNVLDPVLTPLGFAAAQGGVSDGVGQVIFCRGLEGSTDDGCVDLVLDLEASPDWHVTDVRFWGFPAERFHLPFDEAADLAGQLAELARTLPDRLGLGTSADLADDP